MEPSSASMPPSAEQVEEEIRRLCRDAGMAEPDQVVDRIESDREVVLLWHESKVAVLVEVDR